MLADNDNAPFDSQANSSSDDDDKLFMSNLAPLPELTKKVKRKLADQLLGHQINSQLD